MGKKALVLGGGGAKGSYQIGAWKALRQIGKEWDIVVGTSIGSLNGAMVVQDEYEKASDLWDTIEYTRVLGDQREGVDQIETTLDMVRFALSDMIIEGSFENTALQQLIEEYLNEEKLRASSIDFGLMTVEIPSMRPHPMMKSDIKNGQMADFLMASCACFPVFKPKIIDGVKYIDGGYYDNLPVNMALTRGADDIIAVDLDAIGLIKGTAAMNVGGYTKIKPYWDLGASFAFDRNRFTRNRILGYNDGMKAFGYYEGMFYTFKKGESYKNFQRLKKSVPEAAVKIDQMISKPIARTLQTIDRNSIIGFLSRSNWSEDGDNMLCRIAEIAGQVFSISPEPIYTFEEYNQWLLREYSRYGGLYYKLKPGDRDITGILSLASKAEDKRKITADITHYILAQTLENPSIWTVAELLPREFIAAIYIKILVDSKGISPVII